MRRHRLIASAIGMLLILAGSAACGGSGTGQQTSAAAVAGGTTSSSGATPATVSPGTSEAAPAGATPSTGPATPGKASPSPAAPTAGRTTPAASPASSTANLAGRIRPGVTHQGVATAYAAADGDGACLFGPAPDMMIAAMNVTDYETAKACGDTILIHAANGKSVTVRITNECPAPCAPGQIDLSQQAFAQLADLKVGRLSITWTLLSPPTADPVSLRYKSGSSRWWCGIQVIGHRNPVASLEVAAGTTWRQLPRTDYNYFISADGTGCGGRIRVTDIYGQQLVFDGVKLAPDVVQRMTTQFAQH